AGDEQRRVGGVAPLVADDGVRIDMLACEQLLDRVLHLPEVGGEAVERRVWCPVLADHGVHREETPEVAFVRGDDVQERLVDRAVRARHGQLQLLRTQASHVFDEPFRRPNVVPELPENELGGHLYSPCRLAPSSIAYGQTCMSIVSRPCTLRIVAICER